jgi:hypothetical protein
VTGYATEWLRVGELFLRFFLSKVVIAKDLEI